MEAPFDSAPSLTLLRDEPWDRNTALGAWFDVPSAPLDSQLRETSRATLGPFAEALQLLSPAERRRAELLLAWSSALYRTAFEVDPPETRIARIQRAAFEAAKALAGEVSESALLRAMAAEANRRPWGRQPLDELLDLARTLTREPRTKTALEDDARCRRLTHAFLVALFGTTPPAAACDFAAGLFRLGRLLALRGELQARRFPLALELLREPVDHRSPEEVVAAATAELERIRVLLLRGARAAAEVPLTFRRPTLFLVSVGLELLGRLEEQPEALLRGPVELPPWRIWWASRKARRAFGA
jgi:hypothetical protein